MRYGKVSVKAVLILSLIVLCGVGYAELLIDDFNKTSNLLGGRSSIYQQAPSRALATPTQAEYYGPGGYSLMVKYDKKNEGGPYGAGGWCGYYTLLKTGNNYFDAGKYTSIVFYVKGSAGGENFKVGLADRYWDGAGDSVKSEPIGKYLAAGKITTEWQKATLPIEEFFVDSKELASISICFESDCFEGGAGKGTLYIDELKLE